MRHFTIITILLLLPILLSAQRFGEDENLHIPPKLTITQGWGDEPASVLIRESEMPQILLPLPKVFFDNPGEWIIPERYRTFLSPGDAFDYADTADIVGWPGEIDKYYEILNIVGYRMRQDSTAVVGLRGSYSTEPGEDPALARERALVVREYLQTIWNIDSARLPLLPVTTPVDSSSNILLQEEARRVEFVTEDSLLFAPVDYSFINFTPLNVMMLLYVTPNMESERVAEIEIRVLDDDRELLSHASVPGHPDSTTYRLRANWWMSSNGEDTDLNGLLVEARVIMTDGRYRTGDPVPILVRRERNQGKNRRRQMYGMIPFFPPGDTLLDSGQKRMISQFVAYQDSVNRVNSREGLFVVATGQTEMGETPSMDRVEVDTEVMERRNDGLQEEMLSSRINLPEKTSYLYIHEPVQENIYDEDMHYDEMHAEAELGDVARNREGTELDTVGEDEISRPGPFDSDSLAIARARNVITYIRDTLGIEMLNNRLPAELADIRGVEFSLVRESGISPGGGGEMRVLSSPEQRWYHRGVMLFVETAERFDDISEEMERQLERHRSFRNRVDQGGAVLED